MNNKYVKESAFEYLIRLIDDMEKAMLKEAATRQDTESSIEEYQTAIDDAHRCKMLVAMQCLHMQRAGIFREVIA